MNLPTSVLIPLPLKIYHVETRPNEQGRNVIVDTLAGTNMFGEGFNAQHVLVRSHSSVLISIELYKNTGDSVQL
jgi:uncharacterized protein YybS (DUF2232 family)